MIDAVVVGGGPGGSVCAARLAARGRRVVVLERERHPRFHLGESLLPVGLDVLDAIGVLDEVRAKFLVKRGARFVEGGDGHAVRYDFAEAFRAKWDHAFEVPRDAFDELLFRRAGACGAELREGWTVTRIVREDGRAVGVEAKGPDGATHAIEARVVVDASGRDAMTARDAGDLERVAGLDKTALYTQVRGAWRDDGDRAGDIQIVVSMADERRWFWLIPFADGRTSAGAVVSSRWIREHRALGGPEALFDAALRETPAAARMLDGAERLFAPRATSDFSFHVRRAYGPGWVAVGDASGFLDPLFSTGAHLAMNGALRAADVLHAVLDSDAPLGAPGSASEAAFAAWDAEVRAGADLFLGAVQGFYEGELADYIFHDPQHPFLRRAITSLLAGDVFDPDERWAGEIRRRFPPR
ncbi:MAG TPA: tryptophan 7-halogenase [Polyangiaceae bacterium]